MPSVAWGAAPWGTFTWGATPGTGTTPDDEVEMAYPLGLQTFNLKIALIAPNGRNEQGDVQVIAERVFGYTGTEYIFQRPTNWLGLRSGKITIPLPYSDQPGLTGDGGLPLDAPVAYQVRFRPLRDVEIQTLKTFTVSQTQGGTVNFAALADLGGWPHAPIVVAGPAPDTGGIDVVLVPDTDPGDEGLFYAVEA